MSKKKKKSNKVESIPQDKLEALADQWYDVQRERTVKLRTSFVIEVNVSPPTEDDDDFFVDVPFNQPGIDEELQNVDANIKSHPIIVDLLKKLRQSQKEFAAALSKISDEYGVPKNDILEHIETLPV